MVVGKTAKGRPAHKTTSLNGLRPDITQEELLALVEVIRPMLEHPISNVNLVMQTVNSVWSNKPMDDDAELAQAIGALFEGAPQSSENAEAQDTVETENVVSASAEAAAHPQHEAPRTQETSETKQESGFHFPNVRFEGFLSSKKDSKKKKRTRSA